MVPGDLRRKAWRLVRSGDELRSAGKERSARLLYDEALQLADETGVHHLRKKVAERLDSNEREMR